MIKEAIEKILALAPVEITVIDGKQYASKALVKIVQSVPSEIKLSTLSGVVDYVNSSLDKIDRALCVHVCDEGQVQLIQALDEESRRVVMINATTENHGDGFSFSKQHGVEEFIVSLQAHFERTDNLAKILQIVGNLKAERVTTAADDGISQRVATSAGVALMATVTIPNPVSLKPRRTFVEIDQPESEFVFRLAQRGSELPTCALYEADGGAWKLEAIKRIRDYFKAALPNIKVIA